MKTKLFFSSQAGDSIYPIRPLFAKGFFNCDLICNVWQLCKDQTFAHTDFHTWVDPSKPSIKLNLNGLLNGFQSWWICGFRNVNLAANIPLLFTSCSRIWKCLIVSCSMWSTVQNISQSRKRCFPHDSWSCPGEKILETFLRFFLPFSTENTSTRSLVRSSL